MILGYSASQTIALHNAYWIGYFAGTGGIGYWILSRYGFKDTIMAGLAIYACGAMAFWPSSVLTSFPGFVISNGMIALGLACLEVAANPFIALAGPDELMEARLCFSQGIQGIGSILSPILAQKVLFRRVAGRADLFNTQWCYLAVAFFVVFLAIVCHYVPLSEASDADLEAVAQRRQEKRPIAPGTKVLGLRPAMLSAIVGIFSMFLYVGGQESISYYWGSWVKVMRPGYVFTLLRVLLTMQRHRRRNLQLSSHLSHSVRLESISSLGRGLCWNSPTTYSRRIHCRISGDNHRCLGD